MIFCFDTVSPTFHGGVPNNAQAIIFYLDGLYANEAGARARFPHVFEAGRAIGLTVRGRRPAMGDDFEPGNWQGNAGEWVAESIRGGITRPIVYADGSDMHNLVIPSLERIFGRPLAPPGPGRHFRLLLAAPDGVPVIPSDMDGKQYWWGSMQGQNRVDMDVSVLRDDFFGPVPIPINQPKPPEDTEMLVASKLPDGRTELFAEDKNGQVWHTWQLRPEDGGGWVGAESGKRNAVWYSLGTPGAA